MNINTSVQTKKYSQWTNKMKYIMLHHTWLKNNPTDKEMIDYLAYHKDKVSVHYVIDREWEIWQLSSNDKICWHAWTGSFNGIVDTMNQYAIGIEVISDWYVFNDKQRDSTNWLVQKLVNDIDIKQENIIRHADYAPGRRWDIGPNFYSPLTWDEYRSKFYKDTDDMWWVNNLMFLRSQAWHSTKDSKLKEQLNNENNWYRQHYGIK